MRLPLPIPTSKDMLGRKCGHDKKKQFYAAPMQGPPAAPDKRKKLVKEPVPVAKDYDELRARIGKGKK